MKPRLLQSALVLAAACVLLPPASAIKIEIPEELRKEAEAARAAEAAAEEEEESGPMTFGTVEPGPPDGAADDAGFLDVPEFAGPVDLEEGIAEGGRIFGQVFDQENNAPLQGVAILVEDMDLATITDAEGRYTLEPVPAGSYTLSFFKTGYIEANVTDFQIAEDEAKPFTFALPPRPVEMSDDVFELQDFTVTADQASEMMMALDLRLNSDSIMDVLSSEDLSRFAASDVGEAIKRIAGITVEGGEFAVIRGLDERYSSTLLNGAPVPSPDPDRQSVPLDLFPSDVVRNLSVTKTFAADLPGNSAGGSINIITSVFPEEFQASVTGKVGINDNAQDRFLGTGGRTVVAPDWNRISDPAVSTPLATVPEGQRLTPSEENAEIDMSVSVEFGGTTEIFGRAFRYLGSFSDEEESDSEFGKEENRFARGIPVRVAGPRPVILETGDLAKGELPYSTGSFDFTQSTYKEQTTYFGSFEYDLDKEGRHAAGFTYFRTEVEEEIATLRENGVYPGKITRDQIEDETDSGNGLIDFFNEDYDDGQGLSAVEEFLASDQFRSSLIDSDRELEVLQLTGRHDLEEIVEGLNLAWAASTSDAEQQDLDAFTSAGIRLPDGSFVSAQNSDFQGFRPTRSWRRIDEEQDFFRVDGSYTFELDNGLVFEPSAGWSDEKTERDTDQLFFTLTLRSFPSAIPSDTIEGAVGNGLTTGTEGGTEPSAEAEGERDIEAFYFSNKLTINDKLDIIAGVRFEDVLMTTQTNTDGADFFNFDVLRDTNNGQTPTQAILNTQILDINGGRPLPVDFEGRIEEDLVLPSVTLVARPFEGFRATLAYSETNVRPSFKEFTFITVRDPITLDFVSGNPALVSSDVQSWDARLEYSWNDGDLVAVSFFGKDIQDPIEKTTLGGSVTTDIFFNNPNDAEILGLELEVRKGLDRQGRGWLQYFTVGGNVALIDAEVGVPQNFQDLLSGGFAFDRDLNGTTETTLGGGAYGVDGATSGGVDRFEPAPSERRLFQQPEWIINADISFDQPEWGTRATLSVFGQSEVLESAGGFIDSRPDLATVDRFNKSYFEVNLTFSQRISEFLTVGFAVKNLTDSERGIEYDDAVSGADELTYRAGREFSIFATASF